MWTTDVQLVIGFEEIVLVVVDDCAVVGGSVVEAGTVVVVVEVDRDPDLCARPTVVAPQAANSDPAKITQTNAAPGTSLDRTRTELLIMPSRSSGADSDLTGGAYSQVRPTTRPPSA
jgi:hypothetical protein